MRVIRIIALSAMFGALAAGALTAQRGPRAGRGGYGVGTGLWILEQEAFDSFATRLELSDQQRGEIQRLSDEFRRENADVLGRWNQMREEIDALRSGDERPTRDTLRAIGEKYDHPGQALQPRLDEFRKNVAAKLTPEQHARWVRAAGGRGIRGAARSGTRGRAMTPRWNARQPRGAWGPVGPRVRDGRMQVRPRFRRWWPEA